MKKNRKKHLIVKDEAAACCPQIEANTRTIPGIISQRGCAYAGCKGVVVGPIKDMVTITHGPVGCGYYSWGTRRNKARADDTTPKDKIYSQLCFTTDMQEPDIVFGGEKKLAKMIDEVVATFHPRAINICATCPVGLIGDDIGAVAKAAEERHGIQVLAYQLRRLQRGQPVGRPPHRQQQHHGEGRRDREPSGNPANTSSTSSASTTSAATAGNWSGSSRRSATRSTAS